MTLGSKVRAALAKIRRKPGASAEGSPDSGPSARAAGPGEGSAAAASAPGPAGTAGRALALPQLPPLPPLSQVARTAGLSLAVVGTAIAAGRFVQSDLVAGTMLSSAATTPHTIVPLAAPPAAPLPAGPIGATGATAAAIAAARPALAPAPMPRDFSFKDDPGPDRSVRPAAAEATAATAAQPACPASLTVAPGAGAMLALALSAPCSAGRAVTVSHAGLAFSAVPRADGSLDLAIPALDPAGRVAVALPPDAGAAEILEAAAPVDLTRVRRLAVQWQGARRLQLHAFEGGAVYGQPGHVSAASPGPAAGDGAAPGGGWLVALGAPDRPQARMAEIYTFPDDPARPLALTVEAEVTAASCGRTVNGIAHLSLGGRIEVTDLSFAMPGCEAAGDFLVLNYPLPDSRLAAAE